MKILLASNNKNKILELKELLTDFEIYAFNEVLTPFEIEENGTSFKENALIKARAVFDALKDKKEFIVLSDDSGICVDILGGRPGIYSARFSAEKTDEANRKKLIEELVKLNAKESKAHYRAAIAIKSFEVEFVTQGFMHGKVITECKGENGFGYDPLFIPQNFDKTLAELDFKEKNKISHRFKALNLAKILLKMIKEKK